MNRRRLLLCILSFFSAAAYGQTVSSISFDGVGDSSARVIFNASSLFSAVRVRYGTASCASGSGGAVQANGTAGFTFVRYGMTAQLSGLAPATKYYVCPEVSGDGSNWSNGAEATFTTLARTQTAPIAPTPVSTSFPRQLGRTVTVSGDCSDLQAKINTATPGDTIVVPAGTVCTGTYTTPMAPDARSFSSRDVVTSTSTIAIAGHGFLENQEVHFSTGGPNENCLPGMTIFPGEWSFARYNCDKGGGWSKGNKYYVHVVNANHVQILGSRGGPAAVPGWINFTVNEADDSITFVPTWATPGGYTTGNLSSLVPSGTPIQLVSSGSLPGGLNTDTTYFFLSSCRSSANIVCTTQLSDTPGGAPIDITSAGSGVHTLVDQGSGTMYIAPAPMQNSPWIVIRTSGTLPPAGTRITDSTDSQLFQLKKTTYDATPVFQPGILAHNWRIVGALFNTATNNDYLTSTDPRPFCAGPSTNQDNRFIVFDQVRIQGPGYPNRFGCRQGGASMFWEGGYISLINSDLRGLDYWHSWYGSSNGVNGGGLVPTKVSGNQVTATSGIGHGGVFTTVIIGTPTINFTNGSASGTAYVYFTMDGSMKVVAPEGTEGDCTATGTTWIMTAPPAAIRCTFATAANPNWPVDENGRRAGLALFTIGLSGGSVTSVSPANPTISVGPPLVTEGANPIIGGSGPGPYLISNNYISGAGLTMHFDEGGGPLTNRGDYNILNNYFDVPAKTLLHGPSSDGLWYGNRQPLEWKGGQRILISGNTFSGCFAQINNIGTCIVITPRVGGYVTDVDVSNNQFLNVSGMSTIATPADTYAPVSKPAARQRFSNNLATINAWSHYVATEAQPNGFAFYGGNAVEDVTMSHNTSYDNRGAAASFLHWTSAPAGGMSITDNIYFYTANAPMFQSEALANCTGADKSMMDCAFTAGPGNPDYKFTGNLIIPSWSNSSDKTGFVGASAVQDAFGSLASQNPVPQGASQAAVLALVNFAQDYTLNSSSPYYSTCSGGTACGYTSKPVKIAAPKIDSIVNGASFAAGPAAPGQLVAIMGTGLGPVTSLATALDSSGKVSTELGLASVLLNGIPAPLLYASGTQINAMVPYEVAMDTDLKAEVTFEARVSNSFSVPIADVSPALFTANGSGTGPAVIVNPDNSINGPRNAVSKGGQIMFYVTGAGQTDPPGVTGRVTDASSTPKPKLPLSVFIDGTPVPTQFTGAAPGLVSGLIQVNVRIPEDVSSGDLPLVVKVGDKSSQPGVTVSVQ